MNYEFLTNFEYWFKTVRKCAHNTTIKYITNLRKIVNIAMKNDWLDKDLDKIIILNQYPFINNLYQIASRFDKAYLKSESKNP